ncbi:MAG: glycosyltransferase family 4 protein [Patescibacteria group bacterium]
MKIAQITTVFPPYKGGMGQVPWYYAKYLHEFGEDVEVITPAYTNEKIDTPYTVHYLKPLFFWGLAAFCPQVVRHLKKYNVIQLHYPAYGMGVFVVLWQLFVGRRKGKRLYVFYHMDTVSTGWLGLLFRVHRFFVLPLLIKAAKIVFVSTRDYALHSYVRLYAERNPEKFVELPFGVTEEYKPGEKSLELFKKYSIDSNKKIILFVGGLRREHYFKGVHVLLRACAEISSNDWHLVCVGKGDMINEYKKQASDLGIADRVTFTGYQEDIVMPDWYRNAYVTVLPSTDMSEAFGIVLVEALACASPIIASDLPGVRTVGIEGQTGFVVPKNNPRKLAEKLQYILDNKEEHAKMSQTAANLAQDKYLWRRIVEQLLQVYRV